MASLLNAKDDEEAQTQTAQQADTTTTTAAGSTGATGNTSSNTSPTASSTPQEDVGTITNLNRSVDFQPLLDYVGNEGTAARNAIQGENNTFNTAFGSGPGTFGNDQQKTLSDVLGGKSSIDTGRGLLSNTYSGPVGVNRGTYDPLTQRYTTDATNTSNEAGISALLQNMRPDLTQGDLSYDALVFGQNPQYQQASRNLINDANEVSNLGNTTYTNSLGSVDKRKQDISAFNTAANGYVQGQANSINQNIAAEIAAAQARDQALQTNLPNYQKETALSGIGADQLAFDPTAYKPTDFASNVGGDYKATVNPYQYLSYQPGEIVNRNNAATADEIAQYNIAEQLLNSNDRLGAQTRQGSRLGIDTIGLQQALAKAAADRDAADAAWIKAHTPAPVASPYVSQQSSYTGGEGATPNGMDTSPNADISNTDFGRAVTGAYDGIASALSSVGDFFGGSSSSPSPGPGTPNAADYGFSGPQSTDGTGQAAAGGTTGGTGSSNGNEVSAADMQAAGFAKGGLIKSRALTGTKGTRKSGEIAPGGEKPSAAPSNVPSNAPPTQMLLGSQQTPTAPGSFAMKAGGYIPPGTGSKKVDDVPINADDGEAVINRNSVNALGPKNVLAINNVNRLSPAQQQMVKAAIQSAMSRAGASTAAPPPTPMAPRAPMPQGGNPALQAALFQALARGKPAPAF